VESLNFFKIDLFDSDITHVREKLLNGMIFFFSILGFLAVIAGGMELYYQGSRELVYVYLAGYCPVVCCLVFKRYLSYRVRSILLLISLYFLAFFILARLGLSGAGIPLLITLALVATVFLGIKAGFAAVVLGLFSIILIGTLMSSNLISTDMANMPNSTQPVAWIVAAIVFVMIGITMVVCLGILQTALTMDITKAKRSEDINKTLFAISNAVNITLNLQDLYKHIHILLGEIIDVTNFFIAVVNDKENTLYFPYYTDTEDNDFYPVINFNTNDSLTGLVVLHKKPLLLKQEELEERALQNGVHGPVPLIWMGVPLIIKDRVIGVIAVQSYTDSKLFDEQDLQLLSAISDQIAIAIDRKQSYEELEKEKEILFMTLESNPHGIALIDKNDQYIYVNPRFTEITGYTLTDIPSKEEWFEKAYPDIDYRNKIQRAWNKDSARQNTTQDRDFKIKTKCDQTRNIEFRSAFSKDFTISVLTDVTERKKAEKAMFELEKKLAMSQKMESIGLLAGGVAHDLNNVLSGIVGYPDLLLMDLPEDSPLRKPIIGIQNSGQKAADIVQDLLTLARRGVKTTQVICLNDLILQYLASPEHAKLAASYQNVKVKLSLDRELLNIAGSDIHLRKTIMNLVSNAFEAQISGGQIIISTSNKYIDKPGEKYENLKQGDYILLKISDKGMGIAANDLNKIFEPFYTKKVMGRSGTGLGMAVVWGTVQDHHGSINVESKVGKGTDFYLYFPATQDRVADQAKTSLESYKGKQEAILIIDDVLEQREIASKMLERLNYSASSVSSGEKGVEYIKNNIVDLIVLDMIMDPGIDGLETYKRILKYNPDQKVIIASGFSENNRVKEARRLGAGQYLKKPYTFEKIGLAVKKELEK
jgi:PAS domain S-box-containing protein